jgi:hypothetical protein
MEEEAAGTGEVMCIDTVSGAGTDMLRSPVDMKRQLGGTAPVLTGERLQGRSLTSSMEQGQS